MADKSLDVSRRKFVMTSMSAALSIKLPARYSKVNEGADPMPKRILSNWVNGFMKYTSCLPSPEIFRLWTAYSTIAGALERRCWTYSSGRVLHPNMIVLLVGNPGVGKSVAIIEAHSLWAKTTVFNVAPASMTKAAFIDQINSKIKSFEFDGVVKQYSALLLAAPEFGTLLPEYDSQFLSVLNDIYDCNEVAEDRTRGGGLISVQRPHVNIVAGTQPAYLGNKIPESAYGEGFMSRVIMIYAGERVIVDLFNDEAEGRDKELGVNLLHDLSIISKLKGQFEWSEAAKESINAWNRVYLEDAPTHVRLQNYNTRRIIHTMKLAMSVSVSTGNDLFVKEEDYLLARKLVKQAEVLMPEIFKEMTTSADAANLEEIQLFVHTYCQKRKKESVPEPELVDFMCKKIPVNRVDFFIDVMLRSGRIVVAKGIDLPGHRNFSARAISILD